MAEHIGPLYHLSCSDFNIRRIGAWLGMVSSALAKTMRRQKAFNTNLDRSRVMRLLDRTVIIYLGRFCSTLPIRYLEVNVMKNKLLALGLGGTLFAILCCFTPLLPIVLTALGLTGLLGVIYNDAVLLPMLAGFLLLTGYALWRKQKQK